MAVNDYAQQFKQNQQLEYQALLNSGDIVGAEAFALQNGIDTSNVINNTYAQAQQPTVANNQPNADVSTQVKAPANTDFNSVNGGNDWLSLKGALGGVGTNGNAYSGWVSPALSVLQGGANAYLGYQNLQETKKNNAFARKQAEENNRRSAVRYKNLVNEKRRNTGLAMGNSNNYGATVATVARNPYSTY